MYLRTIKSIFVKIVDLFIELNPKVQLDFFLFKKNILCFRLLLNPKYIF